MADGFENFNTGLFIALFMAFIYLVYVNITIDTDNSQKLDNIVCHKEIEHALPKIKDVDKLIIESVISEYWRKRNMNKSNCAKIWKEVKSGIVRGALGGAIVGSGLSGAASGAVVFGTLGGLSKAYALSYGKMEYLRDHKHT